VDYNKLTYGLVFDTDVLLRFKSDLSKLKQLWAETEVSKFEHFLEVEW